MTKIFPAIAIITASIIGTTNAQTPFPQGVTVGVSKPGLNAAAKNYTIYTSANPVSGNYTEGVTFTADYDLNGIGLDSVDNFVYASTYTGENNTASLINGVSLYRIGADGVSANLGYLPTTGQTSIEFPSFSAGTVGNNDAYYYLTIGLKVSGVAKFTSALGTGSLNLDTNDVRVFLCWINNISGLTANPDAALSNGLGGFYEVNFSNPALQTAMHAFLGQVNMQFPNVYNANGGLQDIAINPTDKKIYGYFSYPESNTVTVGRPVVFDFPANNMVTVSPVGTSINYNPNQEIDGITFDMMGNLYGLFTSGDYATIDLASGELTNSSLSNFATASGNLRGDLGAATATPYTTTPLANNLIRFEGKNNGKYNTLNWTTASENNNTGFAIERSNDLKQWTNIATINTKASNGNSSTALNYTYDDAFPNATGNYYRLRQLNKDGNGSYSSIVFISSTARENAVTIFPNPAKQYFNISGLQEGQTIVLTNVQGKTVFKTKAISNLATINISQLSSGIYLVMIADNNGKMVSANKIQVTR